MEDLIRADRPHGLTIAALALIGALLVPGADADARPGDHHHHRARVKLEVVTKSQRSLLGEGRVTVRVRANTRTKVRLRAHKPKIKRLVKPRKVRTRRHGARKVRLKLTRRGRERLGRCGIQRIRVSGRYRRHRGRGHRGRGHRGRGHRGRGHDGRRLGARGRGHGRRASTRDRRRLKADPARCRPGGGGHGGGAPPPAGTPPNPARCDPIDPAECMLPFPNDYFTRPDGSTPTGRRLDLEPQAMPKNVNGVSSFSPELNRNDGFSPNQIILTRVPGIETPRAFRANDLVAQMNIGAYDDPGQRVVLINAETGERQPIWAELDMVPGTANPHNGGKVEGTPNDRALLIHPAVALDYGTRYIVALRDLHDAGGAPLAPSRAFRAYRDRIATGDPAIEARRPAMEDILTELDQAGIERDDLYLAWDFTVASRQNLTQRLVAMRDDAFAQLGDTDLADGAVQGAAPDLRVTGQTRYRLCDSDGDPRCTLDSPTPESDYVYKKVTGTITVPCYMNPPGTEYNPSDPNTPCAAGSRLHYTPGADTPSQGRDASGAPATWRAPFTCVIPRTGENADQMATHSPGIVFGHGLFQNNRIVEQLGLFPGSLAGVACATDWIGLSAIDPVTGDPYPGNDLTTYLLTMIAVRKDLSLFSALPDRSQQGFVNALYLARAMAHPDGLADEPEFENAAGESALDIDPADTADRLAYYGVSLGGIFGGATTAVAPDWQRAVLSVPGMGFTTLLLRSTQFNQFLPLIYSAYPDPLSRQLGISVLQLVWDRGEPSSYVHGMLDGSFGTPRHRVMIHEAFGDHQVTNVQTETLARTLGAAVRMPTTAAGRLDSIDYLFSDVVEPFWTPSQQLVDSSDLNVPGGLDTNAIMYTLDTGPIRPAGGGGFVGTNPNLDWNIAPVEGTATARNDGLDPHEPAATSPAAQQLAIPFLLGQGAYDSCVSGAPSPSDMPPWSVPYSGTPEPCRAPPVHSPGQGE